MQSMPSVQSAGSSHGYTMVPQDSARAGTKPTAFVDDEEMGPISLLGHIFRYGFERFHTKLINSGEKNLHDRLKAEFQTIGTIATLLKAITMNFCSKLHAFRPYFATEESANGGLDGKLHWQYYMYCGLVVAASFFMLTAILMSLINMISVSLITLQQIPKYASDARFQIKIPFLALVYGIVVWHVALSVLMCYMIELHFGICFSVCITLLFMFVLAQFANVLHAVELTWRETPSDHKNVLADSTKANAKTNH